jgi:hypothetical protein
VNLFPSADAGTLGGRVKPGHGEIEGFMLCVAMQSGAAYD